MAYINFRILGYITTLLIHSTNLIYMKYTSRQVNIEDTDVKFFKSMEYRYFTTWTVILQIFYAFYGVTCDILILKNSKKKNFKLPDITTQIREILFAGLVWPCSWVVFTVFWTIFKYDRSLVFPEFLDQIITSYSNHIIHTAIIPIVLWEVVFRPREEPISHARNIAQLTMHMSMYVCVLFFTHFETGIWLYPFFAVYYGTIHFVLIFVYIGLLCLFFYYLQWYINRLIHGNIEKVEVKTKER
ncbi:hypothetical protein K1T71_014244 [Dendrolimus kikuchii]|uniref:Uncharacterized protein n=1 Tax=Dendrolimus kikuchii TaxID=765133 RepID=A0ACC1CFR1_9NEOP|nr:hypothetical protein K1T71_014244 [Dendrolimus kikuchii]